MVNKFGESSSSGQKWNINTLKVIKKVKATQGRVKDYINELKASISLGFTPCFNFDYKNRKEVLPVHVGKEKDGDRELVYLVKNYFQKTDITEVKQTSNTYLLYWKEENEGKGIVLIGPKGDPGLKGNPGSSGFDDVCRWMPDLVMEQFEKNEACCFKITDPSTDLVRKGGAYVHWISRSASKKKAVAIHPSKHILHISKKQHALVFDKSLYKIDWVAISLVDSHSYTCICVTFQVDGEKDQFIVSDYDTDDPDAEFRAISASSKEIRIWGAKTDSSYVLVKHETKKNEWTTILVQWSNFNNNHGMFVVNNKEVEGTFVCTDPNLLENAEIYIGARPDGSQAFKGAISALDIHTVKHSREDGVPVALKNLIISRQMITKRYRIGGGNNVVVVHSPPQKRKKFEKRL